MRKYSILPVLFLMCASCAHQEPRLPASEEKKEMHPLALATIVYDTKRKDHAVITHKEAIAHLIVLKVEEAQHKYQDPQRHQLTISALKTNPQTILDPFSRALLKAITERRNKGSCLQSIEQWDKLLSYLDDSVSVLSAKEVQKRIARDVLSDHSSCAPAVATPNQGHASFTPPKPAPLPNKPSESVELLASAKDTFVNTLYYVYVGAGKEQKLLPINSRSINIVGTLVTVHYEDPAQSKSVKQFTAELTELGTDIGVWLKGKNNANTIGLFAYAYRYGDANDELILGREVAFRATSSLTKYFKLNLAYHIGEFGDVDNDMRYRIWRLSGSYIPKAWR